ncbi:MAG: UDP-N-acetylmuramoylalanyl-D-glutamyl-2,6-diaminopimelate--D-alanyl-D-alanine ligase [Rhizobiaceae bacterium]
MTPLWTGEAIVAATGGRPVGPMPQLITGISIDSRSLRSGEAFFAIKGEMHDGHDFATAATAAGASVLVVAEARLPALGRLSVPMIVVPDVLAALEKVGAAARERTKAKIIAVTGSAGKTSTKEALRHALSAVGSVHASDKSFNNHWGVPLSLARLPEDADFGVFEIGMNHPGEIRPLVEIVRPHVAIVTLIAAAHLGHFRNLDEIAKAKAEIFEGVVPGGHALINRDDQRYKVLEKLARAAGVDNVAGYGENARATVRLTKAKLAADGSTISVRLGGQEVVARIGTPGRHVAQNALAVLGAAHLVGADIAKVSLALADLQAEAGRGRRHVLALDRGEATLIDESYNANPASMRAALELLQATSIGTPGRRVAVLGDMLELGTHAEKLHIALAEAIEATQPDLVLLAGPEMKALFARLKGRRPVEYEADVEALKPVLLKSIRPGDAVVIKSSKGVGFSKLVDALVKEFPARTGERATA